MNVVTPVNAAIDLSHHGASSGEPSERIGHGLALGLLDMSKEPSLHAFEANDASAEVNEERSETYRWHEVPVHEKGDEVRRRVGAHKCWHIATESLGKQDRIGSKTVAAYPEKDPCDAVVVKCSPGCQWQQSPYETRSPDRKMRRQ